MNKHIKYWDENLVEKHIGQELFFLMKYLDEKNITNISFIDIGGNVGKFYDKLSEKYNINNCLIVEPSKYLVEYMEEKFKNNKNIVIFNFGLYDVEGKFYFNDNLYFNELNESKPISDNINLGLSMIKNIRGETQFYTMKKFLNEYNIINPSDITFIKIDTENSDLFIIRDMIDYIEKNNIKPLIIFENNYHNNMSYEDAQNIINSFCDICGYENIDLNVCCGDCFLYPKNK